MNSVLIDLSNLVTGGGVRVAASFLDELARLRAEDAIDYSWLAAVDIIASPPVYSDLDELTPKALSVSVERNRPTTLSRWRKPQESYAVSFTLFGPEYSRRHATRRIVGYADGRSVFGPQPGEPLSARQTLKWKLRGIISVSMMRTVDRIVVESPALRDALRRRRFMNVPIDVVSNTVSSQFQGADSPYEPWGPGETLNLLYVTRPYPHKNIAFLEALSAELDKLGVNARYSLTLTREEAQLFLSPDFVTDRCLLLGSVPAADLPSAYAECHASLFPSLLESFSVTPLESMACGRPVIASDRDFVRATCGRAPCYVDPLDEHSAATVLVDFLSDARKTDVHIREGLQFVDQMPSSRERTLSYLSIIDEELRSAQRAT